MSDPREQAEKALKMQDALENFQPGRLEQTKRLAANSRVLAAALRSLLSETQEDEWEYEYADDDDPGGNVYGKCRRKVTPWVRVPVEEDNRG